MDGQVPEPVKTRRSNEMLEMGIEKQRKYEESFLGKEVEVLIEEPAMLDGRQVQSGHTREYLKVVLEGNENRQNELVKLRLTKEMLR